MRIVINALTESATSSASTELPGSYFRKTEWPKVKESPFACLSVDFLDAGCLFECPVYFVSILSVVSGPVREVFISGTPEARDRGC